MYICYLTGNVCQEEVKCGSETRIKLFLSPKILLENIEIIGHEAKTCKIRFYEEDEVWKRGKTCEKCWNSAVGITKRTSKMSFCVMELSLLNHLNVNKLWSEYTIVMKTHFTLCFVRYLIHCECERIDPCWMNVIAISLICDSYVAGITRPEVRK